MTDKIEVLVFEPQEECYFKEIDNTLEAMQEIVGGYIECVTMNHLDDGKDLVLICNEGGAINGLPLTGLEVHGQPMFGTVIICRGDGGEFASITN